MLQFTQIVDHHDGILIGTPWLYDVLIYDPLVLIILDYDWWMICTLMIVWSRMITANGVLCHLSLGLYYHYTTTAAAAAATATASAA